MLCRFFILTCPPARRWHHGPRNFQLEAVRALSSGIAALCENGEKEETRMSNRQVGIMRPAGTDRPDLATGALTREFKD
jgi:hypothetical protein